MTQDFARNDSSSATESISAQLAALGELMSAKRYEVTPFESEAWVAIIRNVPKDKFIAFLAHHYATSPFAPQPCDATKALDMAVNPAVAFEKLQRLVADCGPYRSPEISDPILVAAIQLLGGWVAVNEQLPAVSDVHAMRAYRERFDACFTNAISQVRVSKIAPDGALQALGNHENSSRMLRVNQPG